LLWVFLSFDRTLIVYESLSYPGARGLKVAMWCVNLIVVAQLAQPLICNQGSVVQGWTSTNPALGEISNLLFLFVYFCIISIYFKTLENKTSIDPNKISRKKHFHI
jgi:hypothetical protein